MEEFKLIAYEKENGEVLVVEEFLDSVNPKMRAKGREREKRMFLKYI